MGFANLLNLAYEDYGMDAKILGAAVLLLIAVAVIFYVSAPSGKMPASSSTSTNPSTTSRLVG